MRRTANRLRSALVVIGIMFGGARSGSAQQSWLDFGAALPRVNVPAFNQGYQGYQGTVQTPGFQNTTTSVGFPSSAGFGTTLFGPRKDWKLGAYVQNTDIGAVIQQVLPGSSAQIAGLEPQDIVVAVAGARIGQFDNRIVDIGDEIRRSTDPNGRVSLLVLRLRTQRLQAMTISLSNSSSTALGSITLRDQQSLPQGAILTVQLQNTSKPYYEIAGGKSVTRVEGFGPYQFQLNYDPQYIDPRDQYALSAAIAYNNQIVYALPQPLPINVAALNQPFTLVLDRATFAAPGGFANNGFPSSNVISAGYSAPVDMNQLVTLFQTLLGRSPSQRELIAWQSYLAQGKSLADVRNKIVASSSYRDRFGNDDPGFIQQAFTILTNRPPNPNEANYFLQQLRSTGSIEGVVAEILSQPR